MIRLFSVFFLSSLLAETYIFIPVLIDRAVHSTVRAAAYLLHDCILVDGMVGSTVGIVARVFGSCIESFLLGDDKKSVG